MTNSPSPILPRRTSRNSPDSPSPILPRRTSRKSPRLTQKRRRTELKKTHSARPCQSPFGRINNGMHTSDFYGVGKKGNKWRAALRFPKMLGYDGRRFVIGTFKDEKQAAKAVDAYMRENFPEYADEVANFPQSNLQR